MITLPHKIRDRFERVEKMKVHREQCRCVVGQVIETCGGMVSVVETTLLYCYRKVPKSVQNTPRELDIR